MFLDFPWFNTELSTMLTIESDYIPEGFKLYYENLNLPSTYLFAFVVVGFLFGVGYLILQKYLVNSTLWNNCQSLLYNVFICGVVASSFLCIQGSWYNDVSAISLNSLFYILGSGIYIYIVL